MSTSPLTPEARLHRAIKECRRDFANGVPREEIVAGLRQEHGLPEAAAQRFFENVLDEIKHDFHDYCKNAEQHACRRFRRIKNDRKAAWSVRLRAQVSIDDILDLPRFAQEPGGRDQPDVLEAYEFYQELLASDDANQHQRIRAEKRLLLLAYGRPKRGARAKQPTHSSRHEDSLRRLWSKQLKEKQAANQPDVPIAPGVSIPPGAMPSPGAGMPNHDAAPHVSTPPSPASTQPPAAPEKNLSSASHAHDERGHGTQIHWRLPPVPLLDCGVPAGFVSQEIYEEVRRTIQTAPPGADAIGLGIEKLVELKSALRSRTADSSNSTPSDVQTPPPHAPPSGHTAA